MSDGFYWRNETSDGPYRYEMVKKDRCCIFLSRNRCTIYENRPLICRFYPFTMFEADAYVFEVDRECEGVGRGKIVDKKHFKKLVEDASNTHMSSVSKKRGSPQKPV